MEVGGFLDRDTQWKWQKVDVLKQRWLGLELELSSQLAFASAELGMA